MTKNPLTAIGSALVVMGAGAALMACPASLDDRCAGNACVAGATSEGGADAAVPPGCKPDVDSTDSASQPCVDNSFALFVDPNGKQDAPGTKEEPLNSISAALSKAGSKPRIYVCEGIFREDVEMTSAVSIFGGYTCGTWSYAAKNVRVESTAPGKYALRIRAVTTPAVISDIEFRASPSSQSVLSSIAGFVSDSPAIELRRVQLRASSAKNGADAGPAETGVSTPVDRTGNKPTTGALGTGGNALTCTCSSGGTSKGGRGGDVTDKIDGEAGETKYTPPVPAGFDGAAGTQADCNGPSKIGGRGGSRGPDGKDASPPVGAATITADGWKPADGVAGENGKPGQGGGGAGGRSASGPGGGGGGGCGGCGGFGGRGGTAGGSSIALVLFNSPVRLVACTLTADVAGNGGKGSPGAGGETGGTGGSEVGLCAGGDGGDGGAGGAGSGGAGGFSVGVAHTGPPPNVDAATTGAISIKTGGERGLGGRAGSNDGKAGDAKRVLALEP